MAKPFSIIFKIGRGLIEIRMRDITYSPDWFLTISSLVYRSDKEKSGFSNELQDTIAQLEQVKKQKAASDKNNRSMDEQISELRSK